MERQPVRDRPDSYPLSDGHVPVPSDHWATLLGWVGGQPTDNQWGERHRVRRFPDPYPRANDHLPLPRQGITDRRVFSISMAGIPGSEVLGLCINQTGRPVINLLKKGGTFSIALLLALSLVVAACGSDDDAITTTAAATTTTAAPAEEEPAPEATAAPDDTMADGGGGDDDVAAAGTTVPEPQNAAPTVGVIGASEVAAGDAVTVDLSSFFGDPDGDELVYEAASSDAAVAVVSVSGSEVSIEGGSEGAAMVTVTARDPGGLWAEQSFDVVVRRWVVSLEVADIEPLTAVGETRRLLSNGVGGWGRVLVV